MNIYDSTRMCDLLMPFGYEMTEDIVEANMVILNTCHIREKASEKIYSEIGKIKKLHDNKQEQDQAKPIIVVAGCVAQAEGDEIFARAPYVDIVVGPQSYHTLPELLAKALRLEKRVMELDFVLEEKFDLLPDYTSAQGVSAYVSVQEGCDKFCTFCVVPYTRGAEFSRPVEQVYREVLNAVAQGAREVQLLGQNVNAYHGRGLDSNICSLADLIKYIAQIPKLERIRYTTSHPIDMTENLMMLFATEPKLMPFLHLPVQSGSDKILKAMNRKHNRNYYLSIINNIRMISPQVVFSSDFIVGFPGETDEDFADTLDLVKTVSYGQCYSFKYSPRPGTPATTRPQVPEDIKSERLAILQQEISKQQLALNQNSVGKIVPVLFSKGGKFQGQVIGKTPYMQSVYTSNLDKNLCGKIVNIKITQAFANSLTGEVVQY